MLVREITNTNTKQPFYFGKYENGKDKIFFRRNEKALNLQEIQGILIRRLKADSPA